MLAGKGIIICCVYRWFMLSTVCEVLVWVIGIFINSMLIGFVPENQEYYSVGFGWEACSC